jgi:hypothetical protein
MGKLTVGVGDILLFGSYLAHRSGPNRSSKDRKAIYATYNSTSEGELHDKYYQDRRELWPATHLRKEGVSYEEGRERYAYGSPMLTIGTGKQVTAYSEYDVVDKSCLKLVGCKKWCD